MSEAMEHAKRELDFVHQHQITIFTEQDEHYPDRLRQCPDAPTLLYGKGQIEANRGKFVSIVGTRTASERGKDITRQLVLDLAAALPEVTIVSGLAYGIDVAAHRAAIEAGIPTIIIPGHGLDRIYPAVHRQVAVASLNNGGLLTEYPSETEPERFHFVERDRLIAGMSDATVVVESKERGGALITAQMAMDYDREIFAYPGRVTDAESRGCNQLIRDQKAALIESADDLIAAMQWGEDRQPLQTAMVELMTDLNKEEQQLLQILRDAPDGVHINNLVMETHIAYSQVASTLTMMELEGHVRALPGGFYRALH